MRGISVGIRQPQRIYRHSFVGHFGIEVVEINLDCSFVLFKAEHESLQCVPGGEGFRLIVKCFISSPCLA